MTQLWKWCVVLWVITLPACGSDDGSKGDRDTDSGTDRDSESDTGSNTHTDSSSDMDSDSDTDMVAPQSGELPAGIPTPEFGYLYDTSLDATLYVDNTNPGCDDDGPGSAETPYCDLFRGHYEVTYEAGDVVHILAGPYDYPGDQRLVMNGTQENPVIIRGVDTPLFRGPGSRINFEYDGSYGILENIEFYNHTRHRVLDTGHHLAFHRLEIHNPTDAIIDFNPVFNVNGSHVLISESHIHHNWRDGDNDAHGIQAGEGSSYVFILFNELHHNSGDSFQGCHHCFDAPPHHVFIGGNVMHDDRENAVDLKTIHDVVVSENRMYGYMDSATSGGDAMVVGSNGYDEATNMGPRNVWIINNEFTSTARGVRIEGVEDVWLIGNLFHTLDRAIQIDNKQYRDITIASNTIWNTGDGIINSNDSCTARSVTLTNNLLGTMTDGRHLDLPPCGNHTLQNNLLWQEGGTFTARVEGGNCTTAAELNEAALASGTLDGDPQLDEDGLPAAGAIPIDAGVSLEPLYALFESTFDASIRTDFNGTTRPIGDSEDVGALEQ